MSSTNKHTPRPEENQKNETVKSVLDLNLTGMPPGIRRLCKEFKQLKQNSPSYYTVDLIKNCLLHWEVSLQGPENTPYQGGVFKIEFLFSRFYPEVAPTVKFTTKIYHCNVSKNGNVGLDMLYKGWKPKYTVSKVMLSIYCLLYECNPVMCLVPEIGHQYMSDKNNHDYRCRLFTQIHAR